MSTITCNREDLRSLVEEIVNKKLEQHQQVPRASAAATAATTTATATTATVTIRDLINRDWSRYPRAEELQLLMARRNDPTDRNRSPSWHTVPTHRRRQNNNRKADNDRNAERDRRSRNVERQQPETNRETNREDRRAPANHNLSALVHNINLMIRTAHAAENWEDTLPKSIDLQLRHAFDTINPPGRSSSFRSGMNQLCQHTADQIREKVMEHLQLQSDAASAAIRTLDNRDLDQASHIVRRQLADSRIRPSHIDAATDMIRQIMSKSTSARPAATDDTAAGTATADADSDPDLIILADQSSPMDVRPAPPTTTSRKRRAAPDSDRADAPRRRLYDSSSTVPVSVPIPVPVPLSPTVLIQHHPPTPNSTTRTAPAVATEIAAATTTPAPTTPAPAPTVVPVTTPATPTSGGKKKVEPPQPDHLRFCRPGGNNPNTRIDNLEVHHDWVNNTDTVLILDSNGRAWQQIPDNWQTICIPGAGLQHVPAIIKRLGPFPNHIRSVVVGLGTNNRQDDRSIISNHLVAARDAIANLPAAQSYFLGVLTFDRGTVQQGNMSSFINRTARDVWSDRFIQVPGDMEIEYISEDSVHYTPATAHRYVEVIAKFLHQKN